MSKRFYVTQFGAFWSLTEKGYRQFLEDGAAGITWNLSQAKYEARSIKKPPSKSKPIDVVDFRPSDYKEELQYFIAYGKQTGFKAPRDMAHLD